MLTIDETPTEPSFEELLEEYEPRPMRPGDFLSGEVLQIDDEVALIDVGGKQEAIVPVKELELLNREQLEHISVGDRVPIFVTSVPIVGDRPTVSIQQGLEYEDWQRAESLLESQEVLELEVTGYNKGGLIVKFDRLQGFVPNSHIPQLRHSDDEQKIKSGLAGVTLPVQVIQVMPSKKRLVLSARAAAEIRRKAVLEALQTGQVVHGVVKNLVNFGAFVDLGGADGLVHISELDWMHVTHPSEVLSPGDELDVLILDVNQDKQRVSLSRKALIPSPLQMFAQENPSGTLVEGVITSVQDYGAFVQLDENVIGLLHMSEMESAGTGGKPKEVFRVGDKVLSRIIDLSIEKERIRLSTRQVSYDEFAAWATQSWQAEKVEDGKPEAPLDELPLEGGGSAPEEVGEFPQEEGMEGEVDIRSVGHEP